MADKNQKNLKKYVIYAERIPVHPLGSPTLPGQRIDRWVTGEDGKLAVYDTEEEARNAKQKQEQGYAQDTSAIYEFFIKELTEDEIKEKNKELAYIPTNEEKGRFTKYQKNVIRLARASNDKEPIDPDRIVLSFPFKDCMLEAGMTKQDKKNKREETFLHEEIDKRDIDTLQERKVLTNFSIIDKTGENKIENSLKVDFFDENNNLKNNLLIKGNNLISLYSLLDNFRGKIKMIYIDPPYNTNNDTFQYTDHFDHSLWLTFMKNRLEVAKQLLTDDGVIFISIDDNEQAYLKILCDEIFEQKNFVANLCIYSNPRGRQSSSNVAEAHEYVLVFAKNKQNLKFSGIPLTEEDKKGYKEEDSVGCYREMGLRLRGGRATAEMSPSLYFPIYYDEQNDNIHLEQQEGCIEIIPVFQNGCLGTWRWSKEKIRKNINKLLVRKVKRNGGFEYDVFEKDYLTDDKTKKAKSIWLEKEINYDRGASTIIELFGSKVFEYAKPPFLLEKIIRIATSAETNDIILDFFAGSGTTGHATLALNAEDGGNRKFIMCEQIDEHFDVCKERITKILQESKKWLGKASNEKVIVFELKAYNQLFIDTIKDAEDKKQLDVVYRNMKEIAFFNFWFDKKQFENGEYKSSSLKEQKQKLHDALDLNQLYLNYKDMDDVKYKVDNLEKELTHKFYV